MGFTFIRSPKDGDVLWCERELGNREDPFGVGAPNNNAIVGHLPRTISCFCSLFLRHNRCITCRITDKRRRSVDLPQGGLGKETFREL